MYAESNLMNKNFDLPKFRVSSAFPIYGDAFLSASNASAQSYEQGASTRWESKMWENTKRAGERIL